ncbi:MAG: AraC family transcriptional regulator [Clostridiaceae bacterium]
MKKIRDLLHRNKKERHFLAFLPSLLISFISIIVLCTLIMGILSFKVVKSFMTDRMISSNNKLLSQYKSSIDIALIEAMDNISLKIMHDLNGNYYLNRYFSDPLESSIANVSSVSSYLNNMSVLNSLVFSLSIYYSNDNLLVSTDYVRNTLYRKMEDQKDLTHYYNIIQQAAQNNLNNEEKISLFFDYGKSLNFKVSEVQANRAPETIIQAVRVSYGYNKSIKGAVIVTVSGDIFKSFLNKHAPEDLGGVFIFNEDGTIISHTDSAYIGHNISELGYQDLLSKKSDSGYFIKEVGGIPSVISYQPSSYSDWMYVSIAPIKAISSVSDYILKILLLVALVSVTAGVLVSFAAAKKLAKPMKSIADYCIKSPYSLNQANVNNEYSLIGRTLNNMESLMKVREAELVKVLPTIKMNFLSALFSDNPPDLDEINARMKILNITFSFKFFCAAAIKLEKLQKSEKVVVYEYEKLKICSMLEVLFTSENSACLFYEKDNTIAVLFNYDFEESTLYKLSQAFFEQTQKQASESIPIVKHMSFGKADTNIRHMSTSFKIALNGLNYSYVFPERYLFTYNDIIGLEENNSFSSKLLLNNLANSLGSLNCEKSESDIENLLKTIRNGSYSYQQIYITLNTCVSMIEDFISTHAGKEINLEKDFKNTANILEFEAWVKKVIHKAFNDIDGAKSNNKYIVMKTQEFIQQNIQNPQLSLEYVAEKLGTNYKYLSRVFKNEIGVKFVDYVSNLKLNHCRNLLINTDLKVVEISDIMKYSTSNYFISRFKMMFGCTPKKYRENYQAAKNTEDKLFKKVE